MLKRYRPELDLILSAVYNLKDGKPKTAEKHLKKALSSKRLKYVLSELDQLNQDALEEQVPEVEDQMPALMARVARACNEGEDMAPEYVEDEELPMDDEDMLGDEDEEDFGDEELPMDEGEDMLDGEEDEEDFEARVSARMNRARKNSKTIRAKAKAPTRRTKRKK